MLLRRFRRTLSLALCFVSVVAVAEKGIHSARQKSTVIHGRLVARVPLERMTSIGLNYESFVLEQANAKGSPALVKLSYRFDQREPRLPKSYLDYSLLHSFRVIRDEDCDERWESISSRYQFDASGDFQGRRSGLLLVSNAPALHAEPGAVLECYAVTPRDYMGAKKIPVRVDESAAQEPPKSPDKARPASGTVNNATPGKVPSTVTSASVNQH